MTTPYPKTPNGYSEPPEPKPKRLPYILFALVFTGYFLVIVTTKATFDWGSFALWVLFGGGIVAILAGARPPGWKRRQEEREKARAEAERQASEFRTRSAKYEDGGRGQF
jgi:hypothetical protein